MNSKLFTFSFSVLSFVVLTISLSTTLCNFFQVYRTVFNLPKPKSTSAFQAKKPLLAAKSDVSTPLAWSNSF